VPRYIAGRIWQAIIVVFGVTIVVFVLQHLIASGPSLARAILGPRANPVSIRAYVAANGLDRSLPVQYWDFLWPLLHGNLGYSYRLNRSVDSVLARDIPNDLVVVGGGLAVAVAIAIPLGIAQAVRRGRVFDHVATVLLFILYAMPSFWLGLVLIELFAVKYSILPAEAPQGSIGQVLSHPSGLVLPILTMTLVSCALFSRYMRAAAIETLSEDYVRLTARAKGLPQRRVVAHHLLRNSASSMLTLVGLSLPAILTWGVLVEYVFNFPGTGLTFYNAAVSSDYALESGIAFLVGVATVVGSLVADILYAVADPRVSYG
jgi:peptide/nickel transport system permease protein